MKPRFTDNQTAALIGRTVLLEEQCGALESALDAANQRLVEQDDRIKSLEALVAGLTRPRTLLTEKEAAEILRVHFDTLKRWRAEMPAPRIPFIATESGDIRYRVEAIETYLTSRERGRKPALKKADPGDGIDGNRDVRLRMQRRGGVGSAAAPVTFEFDREL